MLRLMRVFDLLSALKNLVFENSFCRKVQCSLLLVIVVREQQQ